eukprot:tig00000157_g9651.t2
MRPRPAPLCLAGTTITITGDFKDLDAGATWDVDIQLSIDDDADIAAVPARRRLQGHDRELELEEEPRDPREVHLAEHRPADPKPETGSYRKYMHMQPARAPSPRNAAMNHGDPRIYTAPAASSRMPSTVPEKLTRMSRIVRSNSGTIPGAEIEHPAEENPLAFVSKIMNPQTEPATAPVSDPAQSPSIPFASGDESARETSTGVSRGRELQAIARPDTYPSAPFTADEKSKIIAYINELRDLHSAPPVVWDDTLAGWAQFWSEKMAADNNFEHSGTLGFTFADGAAGEVGENLAMFAPPRTNLEDALRSNFAWWNEVNNPGYDFSNPGFSYGTGHFT